jgi:TP901 family phage tail tape measure protein
MGVAGQIFAARVAIGLAIPSPKALQETGGILQKGLQGIYGRLNSQRVQAQKNRLSQAKNELSEAQTALDQGTANMSSNVAKRTGQAVKNLIDEGRNLDQAFRSRKKEAFKHLRSSLPKEQSRALMQGIRNDMTSIQKVAKMSRNFSKMTVKEQDRILLKSKQLVRAKEDELELIQKDNIALENKIASGKKLSKAEEKRTLTAIKHGKELEEQLLEDVRILKEEDDILQEIGKTAKNEYGVELEKVGKLKDNVNNKTKRLNREEKKLKDMLQQIAQKARAAAQAIAQKLNAALQGYTDTLRQTVSVLTGFFYKLNQSTQQLIEFERELLNANSVFNVTRDELFDTGEVITQFGQKFGMEMQNGATGLYQLASAGLDAESALKVLPETLKLSMAVQGDHNTISKLTTQTLAGFEMEMDQAAEVTDKFAHAIQKSLIEYEDLSSAVKFALPFFTATGQSIDQLLGALQILTNRALEAGIAGRGLRQALAEFAENADNNEAAFRKMGINIKTASGEMKQLTEIAAEFSAVVGEETVSNTELLTTLIDDLNVRGATAFIHLVQASDEFTEAVHNTENAGGELDEMVRIQNESMSAQIQILKNNVQAMFFMRDAAYEGTEFMNGFHEAIVNMIRSLSDLIVIQTDAGYQLTEFGKGLQDVSVNGINQLGAFMKELVMTIKEFSTAGFMNIDMLKVYLLPLKILLSVIQLLGPQLTKLILTFHVLNKTLMISAIVQGIMNIEEKKAIGLSLMKIPLKIKEFILTQSQNIADATKNGILAIQRVLKWDNIKATAIKLGQDAKDIAQSLYKNTIDGVSLAIETARNFSLKAWVKTKWASILATGAGIIAAIKGIFTEGLRTTVTLAGVAANIAFYASMVLMTLGVVLIIPLIIGFVKWIMTAKDESFIFGQVLSNTAELIKAIGAAIVGFFTGGGSMNEIFFKFGQFLVNTIALIGDMGNTLKDALMGIVGVVRGVIDGVVGVLRGTIDAIKDAAASMKDKREGAKDKSYWKGEEGLVPDWTGFAAGGMMPGYSYGGIAGKGMAMVGERGPELLKLPGASQVLNSNMTKSIMGRAFDPLGLGRGGGMTLKNVRIEGATISLDTFKGGMQS